jgi:hypothetical protein
MLDSKVFLELFVKVSRNWTSNPQRLANLGYGEEEEGPATDSAAIAELVQALAAARALEEPEEEEPAHCEDAETLDDRGPSEP